MPEFSVSSLQYFSPDILPLVCNVGVQCDIGQADTGVHCDAGVQCVMPLQTSTSKTGMGTSESELSDLSEEPTGESTNMYSQTESS